MTTSNDKLNGETSMTFKVGDRVVFDSSLSDDPCWEDRFTWFGQVTNGSLHEYPVRVKFDNGCVSSFTKDGKYWVNDLKPSLSLVQSEEERKELFHTVGQNVGKICAELDKATVTIPVEVFLSGKTYNGHHQSQLALHGLKDIELINEIAKAFEKHFSDLDGFVWTQVWPDGAWTIYLEAQGQQTMLLASKDD